jgi:hypothetical protein
MIRANRVPARRGWEWVKRGVALFRKEPKLWLAMAFVYLVLALVLEQIPFIGWLVLALLTPTLMLGALPVAAALDGPGLPAGTVPALAAWYSPRAWLLYLRNLFTHALNRLLQGFASEDKLLPIMVISTLLLGGLVAIRILAQLLKVGGVSTLPTVLSGGVGPTIWLTALLGLTVVLALESLLIMAFLYTAPLILFKREYPLPAIEASFSAALNNLGAFAVFAAIFWLASELARSLYHKLVFPFDYLAFFAIGVVTLPVFINALYASYQDLYLNRSE